MTHSAPESQNRRHTFGTGFLVGADALVGFKFDPQSDHAGCMICGSVFQTDLDRRIGRHDQNPVQAVREGNVVTQSDRHEALMGRKTWQLTHARTHSYAEHARLRASGMMCTPEAAQRLVNYGIIPVSDMVLSDEHRAAAAEAPRHATDDAEGS